MHVATALRATGVSELHTKDRELKRKGIVKVDGLPELELRYPTPVERPHDLFSGLVSPLESSS